MENVTLSLRRLDKTVVFLYINNIPFILKDVVELIDGLEDTNGVTSSILIYNDNLANVLENLGIVNKNTRGSWYMGSKYTEFKETLENFIDSNTIKNHSPNEIELEELRAFKKRIEDAVDKARELVNSLQGDGDGQGSNVMTVLEWMGY